MGLAQVGAFILRAMGWKKLTDNHQKSEIKHMAILHFRFRLWCWFETLKNNKKRGQTILKKFSLHEWMHIGWLSMSSRLFLASVCWEPDLLQPKGLKDVICLSYLKGNNSHWAITETAIRTSQAWQTKEAENEKKRGRKIEEEVTKGVVHGCN